MVGQPESPVGHRETARVPGRGRFWPLAAIGLTCGCRPYESFGFAGLHRYCLHDSTVYMPEDESVLVNRHRLCWRVEPR